MTTKVCTKCKVTKGLGAFHKQKCKKDGLRVNCKPCRKAKAAAEYPHKKAAELLRSQTYSAKNPDKVAAKARRWQLKYPEKCRAIRAKRRAAKLERTPSWLTDNDWKWIAWYYKQAKLLSELTGIPHEVDHMIPLQGKTVSGFHCPTNLQILTKLENNQKSNSFDLV